DITNHSYGGPNYDLLLKEGLDLLYKCESIFVASRGNYPNPFDTEIDDPMYPASFYGERVLNIGGNGTDGQWKTDGNGNPLDDDDNQFQSMTHWGVDCIAPSTNMLVLSTEANTNEFSSFNGTSAAAPHVAGLAAMMLSFYGNNLAPEDVEKIIENNCIDVNDTGHDFLTGYGRIDVEATLEELQQPEYQVLHVSGSSEDFSLETVSYFQDILLQEYLGSIEPGTYASEVYNITYSFNHTLSESTELLGSWVRNSNTTGFIESITGSGAIKLPAQNGSVKVSINETEANIKTRLYKVTHKKLLATYIDIDDVWLPGNPEEILLNYTLHIFDPLATNIGVSHDKNTNIIIYPNPVYNSLTIEIPNAENLNNYRVLGIDGKTFLTNVIDINTTKIEIDVSSLNSGIYLLIVTNDYTTSINKFVKL
ncbi:MAG TPA: S8/S53 family peptidase, partial [Chitinophagales bacterium]|nr:S8/S53 family peptidase [Chitinophagales bacterium]